MVIIPVALKLAAPFFVYPNILQAAIEESLPGSGVIFLSASPVPARRTQSRSRLNKMALVPSKFRDANPSGAKMLARVLVVIGVSRLG